MPRKIIIASTLISVLLVATACMQTTALPEPTITMIEIPAQSVYTEVTQIVNTATQIERRVTETPETITVTPTPAEKVEWHVPARVFENWPTSAMGMIWQDDETIQIVDNYDENEFAAYDLRNDSLIKTTPVFRPTATPLHQANEDVLSYSPKRNYATICSEKEQRPDQSIVYHALELYRVKDGQLIGRIRNVNMFCSFFDRTVSWAQDETVLSFTSVRTTYDKDPYPIDIYAWKTDGSIPFILGKGVFSTEAGSWSPDAHRLVVPLEFSYVLLSLDGLPPKENFADLSQRPGDGLAWLNNEIMYQASSCCVTCLFETYFLVETGEEIQELDWMKCSPFSFDTQRINISPDKRWAVIDQTRSREFLDSDEPYEFIYALVDLQTLQTFELSRSGDQFLDFIGWVDPTTFWMVRRPINDTTAPKPDEPYGLVALDASSQQVRLLDPDIRFLWMSPDNHYYLGAGKSDRQLVTAIYAFDGTIIGETISLGMPDPIVSFAIPGLDMWNVPGAGAKDLIQVEWSNDGSKVVFRDVTGALWLADSNGWAQKMADHLPPPELTSFFVADQVEGKYETTGLIWSPKDDYLIVRSGDQVWILNVK